MTGKREHNTGVSEPVGFILSEEVLDIVSGGDTLLTKEPPTTGEVTECRDLCLD